VGGYGKKVNDYQGKQRAKV